MSKTISQTTTKERIGSTEQDSYEIIIQPNRSWFYIDWRGLLHYRDLLFLLVRRDFVSKYKQTVLGPAWHIIQPLLVTLVFTVIFGKIAKIPTDGLPPMLFYLCGMLAWTYFACCLNGTSRSFTENASLFGKVYFPRLIVPLSFIISNIFSFVLQLFTFLCFFFYFKFFTQAEANVHPNLFIFVLPLLFIQMATLGLGIGLWLSVLSAKYRDFAYLTGFLTQLWLYATPIIYPSSILPAKWRWVIAINPMASVIESFRYAFLGAGTINPNYIGISAVVSILILFSGILMFNKTERTFIDTV